MKVRNGEGNWRLVHTENMDDLWYLKNILGPGSLIRKTVMRRDEKREDMTRSKETSKKPVTVTVMVEGCEFQPFTDRIRVRGTIQEGPVELMGQHQSVPVSSDDDVEVMKENWQDYSGEMLREAMMKSSGGCIFVVMDDEVASVSILRDYGIHNAATIFSGKSGKSYASNYSRNTYFAEIMKVIESTEGDKPVVITGPGFEGAYFLEYTKEKKTGRSFMQVQSTGNTEGAIYEIIGLENVRNFIGDSRLTREKIFMEDFLKELGRNGNCTYGPQELEKYAKAGAISRLMVLETFVREEWVRKLMDTVSKSGAEVIIASEHGEFSRTIIGFGGSVALLRYRI